MNRNRLEEDPDIEFNGTKTYNNWHQYIEEFIENTKIMGSTWEMP